MDLQITTSSEVSYSSQLSEIQSSLDSVNANLQLQNSLTYYSIVIASVILISCLFYKVLKIFI